MPGGVVRQIWYSITKAEQEYIFRFWPFLNPEVTSVFERLGLWDVLCVVSPLDRLREQVPGKANCWLGFPDIERGSQYIHP